MLSQLGPHLLLLFLRKWVRYIQFSLFTLHKPQELLTELHILCCAKQKHCDTWTTSLSYFILYHKDLAGHMN